MRLLKLEASGEFSLTEFVGDSVPQYAILSHTWGADDDEVAFKDLIDHTGKNKAGNAKIQFCAKQAANDGLQYFWVDTCCIDKSSSAELTEAINSMFCWYREAVKCYVHLSDVSRSDGDEYDHLSRSTWKLAFRKSRWFTRGWTLQELIAPKSVEFFSLEGERLGSKISMEQQVYEITGIDVQALRGNPLSNFSVTERMSWAAKRKTTRKEDKAYSLLGIFDIHMPLIYGEGEEKAFIRLREEIEKSAKGEYREDFKRLQSSSYARQMDIYQWLSPPDPSLNYQEALKQRQADTGLWFLESDEYAQWKIDPLSFLWLYGIPGCGKTILSSTILQSILQYCADNPRKAVMYFYFDFNDVQKQLPELMIRSLISQLSQQCVKIPTTLEALFSSCGNGERQPSLDALLEVLYRMLLGFPQSYIVLDALDECADRAVLMGLLERMAGWRLENLHILVTSRREQDIENSLESIVDKQSTICLESKLVNRDINKYVCQRLSNDKGLKKWQKDPDIRHEIEARLMEGAHGMFRWAMCQLDALGRCLNRAMLRKALADLPPTLDATYERILCSIQKDYSEYAIRILRWLAFSSRPLLVEEISEVVAIDVERDPAFNSQEVLENPLDVLTICSSLVTLATTENSGMETSESTRTTVLLAHYSVKEYLISERCRQGRAKRYSIQETTCNEFLAKSCLGYLLQFQEPDSLSNRNIQEFKLAWYSAKFWITHTQAVTKKTEALNRLAMKFFSTRKGAYLNWIRIYDPDQPWNGSNFQRKFAEVPTPLYYASQSGLTEIVTLLIVEAGADVNVQGGVDGTALQAASLEGHDKTVELLLSKGADISAQDGGYGTALQAASLEGHDRTVELLLSKGADVNAQGGGYGTALRAASFEGHDKTVELLLSKGADINAQGGELGTALQAASYRGHDKTVELLLSKGADVNAQGGWYGTALQAASYRGYNKIVELLLSKGADINAQGGKLGTALQAASIKGYVSTIELLLQKGADANVQGGCYGNAYNRAAFNGRTELLRLLLTGNRVGQDLRDDQGRSALHLAARGGHIDTMDSLLALGMDINVKDMRGDQILSYAASGASALTVQRILQHPSLCVEESDGWSPLHWACRIGDAEVLRLLIDRGFRGHVVRTSEPQALWTPYSIAIFHGNRKLLSELENWRSDLFTCEHTLSEATQIFAEKVSTKVAEKVLNVICDSCEHDIYGPRFHCVICPDFDYCFMCKLTADKSHPGHEWEKTETYYETSLERGNIGT